MSTVARRDLQSYVFPKTDDPVIRARQLEIARLALDAAPEVREEERRVGELKGELKGERVGELKGELKMGRSALRSVLTERGLVLSAEDDARVDACTDLDTLQRWLRQAVVASSAAEALRAS